MRKSWRRKGQRISKKNRLLIYLNSILLHFLQWRWESNFALRETVTASSWKGRSSLALLFFLLCLLRAGFTITKKAEAGSCRVPGSREELCLAGRPWGPLQGQRWFSLSPQKLVGRMPAQRQCCAPEVRGSRGSPGCCTACGQIFCWAGAVHTGSATGLFTWAEPPVSSLSNCSSCRQRLSDRAQLLLFLGAMKRPKHLNLWHNNFPCGYTLMS